MSVPGPITARSIAVKTLCQAELRREFAGEILNQFSQLTERQQATDLVFGVIRNRKVIDVVIEKFSSFRINNVPGNIINIIRVGIYEIIFCPQTPEYAIVDEAVEYAKSISNKKQAGLVNAVLRETLRHIINRRKAIETYLPSDTVPQTRYTGCQFNIELFPDRDALTAQYLSMAFSLPDWLVKNWLDEYGKEQTENVCFASNRRPSIYFRVNNLRITTGELIKKIQSEGINCEIIPDTNMIKLDSPGLITNLPGFSRGFFIVQDITASSVVRILQPQPGWSILDLCSAPGTKTTQLAEVTGSKAKIVATDIDDARLEMVRENISRLDLTDCVMIMKYNDIYEYAKKIGGFDCVLVDAPCSNTGVLARRPEVRHKITQQGIRELTKVQADLLSRAAKMLKPAGILCYSTCSIQQDENTLVVKPFFADNSDFKLKYEKLTLPAAERFDCDGGYVAIIENI